MFRISDPALSRLVRGLLLLAIIPFAQLAIAQTFNMEDARVQMAPLDGLMRFHTGDDPRWSAPNFDDSAWPLISSNKDWRTQGYGDLSGFGWYRFTVVLPRDRRQQLGMYVPPIRTSYQVFADGKLVGSFGGFPPDGTIRELHQHLVLLPQSQSGRIAPGEILAAMNQRMLARSNGGFTTCLVLRVERDGSARAANAGHIAPYVNGTELHLQNGLPLGLAAASEYVESDFLLTAGSRITLLTDGVLEARNDKGDLFGFERTAEISTAGAEIIATAAQEFGQDDDITVLTLEFAGAGIPT